MTLRARFEHRQGDFRLDLDLEAPARGVTALFGPSGAGKTTLLRLIAGLERPRQGRLELDGELWQDDAAGLFLAPHRRPVGVVFQESSLFAHLPVEGNLRFGWRRVPAAQRRLDYDRVVELLRLGALLERSVDGLSGGERRRVAIGRALLVSPRLLLLDEPMTGLDEASRDGIAASLDSLQRELEMPVLYVSHALDEVTRLADHLLLLGEGRLLGGGPTREMVSRLDLPISEGDVAQAVLGARVVGHDEPYHLTELELGDDPDMEPRSDLRLLVPRHDLPQGRRVRVAVLARDVSLALERPRATSILNILPARVEAVRRDGDTLMMVRLDVGGANLLSRITRRSGEALDIRPGRELFAQVKAVALLR